MPPIRAAPFRKVPSRGVWPVLPGASPPHCCWPGLWVATGCAPSPGHTRLGSRLRWLLAAGPRPLLSAACLSLLGVGSLVGPRIHCHHLGRKVRTAFTFGSGWREKSKQEEYLLTCENLCEVQIFASVKRFYQVLELAPHSSVWLEPRELAGERGRGQAGALGAPILGAHVPSTCCVLCTGHPLC